MQASRLSNPFRAFLEDHSKSPVSCCSIRAPTMEVASLCLSLKGSFVGSASPVETLPTHGTRTTMSARPMCSNGLPANRTASSTVIAAVEPPRAGAERATSAGMYVRSRHALSVVVGRVANKWLGVIRTVTPCESDCDGSTDTFASAYLLTMSGGFGTNVYTTRPNKWHSPVPAGRGDRVCKRNKQEIRKPTL